MMVEGLGFAQALDHHARIPGGEGRGKVSGDAASGALEHDARTPGGEGRGKVSGGAASGALEHDARTPGGEGRGKVSGGAASGALEHDARTPGGSRPPVVSRCEGPGSSRKSGRFDFQIFAFLVLAQESACAGGRPLARFGEDGRQENDLPGDAHPPPGAPSLPGADHDGQDQR